MFFRDTEWISIANFYPKTIIWAILAILECGSIRLSALGGQGPNSYLLPGSLRAVCGSQRVLLSSERVQSGPLVFYHML